MSKTTNKYAPEVRERAVRMVLEHEREQTTPAWPRLQHLQTHQTFDTMQAAYLAFGQHIMPDPPCAICPIAGDKAGAHPGAKHLVAPGRGGMAPLMVFGGDTRCLVKTARECQ